MNTPRSPFASCLLFGLATLAGLMLIGMLGRFAWILLPVAAIAVFIWYRDRAQNVQHMQALRHHQHWEQMKRNILHLAARNHGLITPMDVVLASEMSLDEASRILEQMRMEGYAQLRVADNGSYVYHFDGILSHQQKLDSEQL